MPILATLLPLITAAVNVAGTAAGIGFGGASMANQKNAQKQMAGAPQAPGVQAPVDPAMQTRKKLVI